MGGEYIICPQHDYEGIAKYGECPECNRETEKYMEEHPVKDVEDELNIPEKIRKKLKKREERDKKRKVIGLARHDRFSPGKVEYDDEKKEIRDEKTGEVLFVSENPYRPYINIVGHKLADSYNDKQKGLLEIIYTPDPTIPLESDERKELQNKVRGLELQLKNAWVSLASSADKRVDLNAKILRFEMNNQQDLETLKQIINDYLNQYR